MVQRRDHKRGAVGNAAEALRAALTSKLVPVPACEANPVNDGLMKALNAVDAFLHAHKEAPEDLEQLKQQVKSLMLRAVSPIRQAQASTSAPGDPTSPNSLRSSLSSRGSISLLHGGQRHASTASSMLGIDWTMPQHVLNSKAFTHTGQAHRVAGLGSASSNILSTASQSASVAGTGTGTVTAGRRASSHLYSQRRSGSAAGLLGVAATTATASHSAGGHHHHSHALKPLDFGTLVLTQDELAGLAEQQRRCELAGAKKRGMAVLQSQLAELASARALEVVRKQQEARQLDEDLAVVRQEQEVARVRALEKASAMRSMFGEQVKERETRRAAEEAAEAREQAQERARLQEIAQQEKAAAERRAAANVEQRARVKRELVAAMKEKEEEKQKQMAEELRYNAEYMARMDAEEAARRRTVAAREEKLRRAFERGGGKALAASLEEQAKIDAERAARMAAEHEAELSAKEHAKALARQQANKELVSKLKEQMADKEAAKVRERQEAVRIAAEYATQAAEDKQRAEEAKERKKKLQAETRASQKVAIIEEHKRHYLEYRDPILAGDAWLHREAVVGTRRAFNNLAVPEGKETQLHALAV